MQLNFIPVINARRPTLGSVGKLPVSNLQEKEFVWRSQNLKENLADFENIFVGNHNSVLIRLKDVAKVSEGSRSFDFASFEKGKEVFQFHLQTLQIPLKRSAM